MRKVFGFIVMLSLLVACGAQAPAAEPTKAPEAPAATEAS